MINRYTIGGEERSAVIFAVIYFVLGLLFGSVKVSLIVFILFSVTLVLNWRGYEAPLAIYIRTIHIIFIGLIFLSLLNVF